MQLVILQISILILLTSSVSSIHKQHLLYALSLSFH